MPTEVAASWVGGKMGSEFACILVEPTRLADKLDVGCERKKEKMATYVQPKNWKLPFAAGGAIQFKNSALGVSLVVQWLRICLPMQGTRVRALVREDPTCRRATKPVRHNY